MDRHQRYIAQEMLHGIGVLCAHQAHELYRIAHHQREGLTEKEYRFLMGRHKAMEEEMRKLHALGQRLKNHG